MVSRRGESRDGKQTGVVLSIGRRQRIAPNFILGAIADATGIPGKQVGKIDIYDDYTVVQLGAEDARLTAETMATCRINGHKTEVRLLTKADLAGKNSGGRRRSAVRTSGAASPTDGWTAMDAAPIPSRRTARRSLAGRTGKAAPMATTGRASLLPAAARRTSARARIPAESGK